MAEKRIQAKTTAIDTPAPQPRGRMLLRPVMQRWLLCFALFLVVAGARWWMVGTYGSDLPYWDQWDEAANLFKPYYDGTLSLGDWFKPQNEHRIVFTRILELLTVLANGQWDARLEMTINAVLYACIVCGIFLIFSRGRGAGFSLIVAGWLAAVSVLPYAWENTLSGFQSQFYFLVAFSLASLYLLIAAPAGSRRWAAGALIGFAGLFTMSSGLLAPAAALGMTAVMVLRDRSRWRGLLKETGTTALVSTFILGAGSLLMVRVGSLAPLQASSVEEFIRSLAACFAWPNGPSFMAVLTWLPYAALFFVFLSRRTADGPEERFLLAMGLWVMLQAAAMSYARAHAGIQSRYTDVLAFGLTTNFLCALFLARPKQGLSKPLAGALVLWTLMTAAGLYQVSFNNSVTFRRLMYENERIHTAGYVATGDMRFLTPTTSRTELDIPFHTPKRLAELLRDPAIGPKMPVGIQKSLPLIPEEDSPRPAYIEKSTPRRIVTAEDIAEQTGIFSRFAVIKPGGKFRYRVEKNTTLPLLYLYYYGNAGDFSLIDSRGGMHRVVGLPSRDPQWRCSVVSCPTQTGTLTGTAGNSEFTLMEPKEIGWLSISALVFDRDGLSIAGAGAALFLLVGATALLSASAPADPAAKPKHRRS